MSVHPDPASPLANRPRENPESADVRTRVAGALHRQAAQIAERWGRQSRQVMLREQSGDGGAGFAMDLSAALVESLAAGLSANETTSSVSLGLTFGIDAFEDGTSLHHMLKSLDLLVAMVMFSMEAIIGDDTTGGMSDGIRLCRRLNETASVIRLASTRGFMQAMSDGMRDRFKHLRHDLRNPLGNIKSVLALMDDETIPADARANPRFRTMAGRNARSLEELIGARLSDAAALLPVLSVQSVSLRTLACAVRRDLRREWEERGAVISVANESIRVHIDAVSLDIVLHAVLLAALQEAREGDEILITFAIPSTHRSVVLIAGEFPRDLIEDSLSRERLLSLVSQVGAKIEIGHDVRISMAMRETDESEPRTTVLPPHADAVDSPVASAIQMEP